MQVTLRPADLAPFAKIDQEKAEALIADVIGLAVLKAPCITEISLTDPRAAGLKAILRGIVLRLNEAGSGAAEQVTSGPFTFGVDTRQSRKAMLTRAEIEELQQFCEQGARAHEIDTMPARSSIQPDSWVAM